MPMFLVTKLTRTYSQYRPRLVAMLYICPVCCWSVFSCFCVDEQQCGQSVTATELADDVIILRETHNKYQCFLTY